MFASAHTAAGFAAGMASAYVSEKRIPRVVVAFCLGLLSHVALDAIPHADYFPLAPSTVQWIAIGEVIGIWVIAGFIVRPRLKPGWPWYLLPGLFGAVIPDVKFPARVLLSPHLAMSVARHGDYFHSFFHAAPMRHPLLGWGTEIAATILLLIILGRFPRN
jgi:hypothetical protein